MGQVPSGRGRRILTQPRQMLVDAPAVPFSVCGAIGSVASGKSTLLSALSRFLLPSLDAATAFNAHSEASLANGSTVTSGVDAIFCEQHVVVDCQVMQPVVCPPPPCARLRRTSSTGTESVGPRGQCSQPADAVDGSRHVRPVRLQYPSCGAGRLLRGFHPAHARVGCDAKARWYVPFCKPGRPRLHRNAGAPGDSSSFPSMQHCARCVFVYNKVPLDRFTPSVRDSLHDRLRAFLDPAAFPSTSQPVLNDLLTGDERRDPGLDLFLVPCSETATRAHRLTMDELWGKVGQLCQDATASANPSGSFGTWSGCA